MIGQVRKELVRLGASGSIMAWETGDVVELELYGWDGARLWLAPQTALWVLRGLPDGFGAESTFTALEAAR